MRSRFALAALVALAGAAPAVGQSCYGGGGYAFPSYAPQRYGAGPAYGGYSMYGSGYSNGYGAGYAAPPAPRSMYYGEPAEYLPPPVVYESREPYGYRPPTSFRYEAPARYAAPSYYYPQSRRPLFSARAEVNLGRGRLCPTCP